MPGGGPIQITHVYDKAATAGIRATKIDTILREFRSDLAPASKTRHADLKEPLVFCDINFHVGIPVFGAVSWAHVNVLIRDDSAWSSGWDAYLQFYDAVLTATEIDAGPSVDLLEKFKGIFATAQGRRPTEGVVHCPPILTVEDCPPISIVTPSYNRRNMIDIAFHNLMATDYPQEKIEWVIVEDNEHSDRMASDRIMSFQVNNPKIKVKYIPIEGRMTIGEKRNIGVEHASNDIIAFMDDDDHYPVTSLRRRIAWLLKGRRGAVGAAEGGGEVGGQIVFCTTIALYDLRRGVSAVNVPPWGLRLGERISEATLTFRKQAWLDRKFPATSMAEGCEWIDGREGVCIEIPPQQIIVAFSHHINASQRRIPPTDSKDVGCFWGFPKEYLVFIHRLVGVEIEDTSTNQVVSHPGRKSKK